MKTLLKLLPVLLLTSCVSPRQWSHDRHLETMNMCQYMCGEQGVKRYIPQFGTCECEVKKKK